MMDAPVDDCKVNKEEESGCFCCLKEIDRLKTAETSSTSVLPTTLDKANHNDEMDAHNDDTIF